MARAPSKHDRDRILDLDGFLNNLQDWELSSKDNEKKLKSQAYDKDKLASSQNFGLGERIRSDGKKLSSDYSKIKAGKHDYSRIHDSMTHMASAFMNEENSPDAASEKEVGNERFKQKKFKEAIDCYSRSIALSPSAVAYANRAMAFLKIKKFQEAEDDCTEALNLDDRYVKAYLRRATARKELKKLKESIEDSEFALRLEPQNQEIKKQHAETKSLYQKEILQKTAGSLKASVPSASQADHPKLFDRDTRSPMKTSMPIEEVDNKKMVVESRDAVQANGLPNNSVHGSGSISQRTNIRGLDASVQQLASQAALRAATEAAKNIAPPNSAYQFEVSWRALSGDCALQACLLKSVPPNALPQIFKNALSAPMLVGIVKCIASFFREETELAVKYLDRLTKVARFDMIVMCLSSVDKADILTVWDEVFSSQAIPAEFAEMVDRLRPKYVCIRMNV